MRERHAKIEGFLLATKSSQKVFKKYWRCFPPSLFPLLLFYFSPSPSLLSLPQSCFLLLPSFFINKCAKRRTAHELGTALRMSDVCTDVKMLRKTCCFSGWPPDMIRRWERRDQLPDWTVPRGKRDKTISAKLIPLPLKIFLLYFFRWFRIRIWSQFANLS